MDYKRHYETLIERSRDRVLIGYIEHHHVIPCCLGGGNNSENLVALTAAEHFVAHLLLVKIYPDEKGLLHAAFRMSNSYKTGSKEYGWLKKTWVNSISGDNNPAKRPEVRALISSNNPMKNEKHRLTQKESLNTSEIKIKRSIQVSGKNNPSCVDSVKELRRINWEKMRSDPNSKINPTNMWKDPIIRARILEGQSKARAIRNGY